MNFSITIISTLLLSILLVILSIRVIILRRTWEDTSNPVLMRAIRGHGNLTEYAPFFLILLGFAEYFMVNQLLLILVSIIFIIWRYIHGILFWFSWPNPLLRVFSMICTFIGLCSLIGIHIYRLFFI